MKVQVPTDYKKMQITNSNHFIAKNNNKDFFMVELPTPVNQWWIDGCYADEDFIEITLVDAVK